MIELNIQLFGGRGGSFGGGSGGSSSSSNGQSAVESVISNYHISSVQALQDHANVFLKAMDGGEVLTTKETWRDGYDSGSTEYRYEKFAPGMFEVIRTETVRGHGTKNYNDGIWDIASVSRNIKMSGITAAAYYKANNFRSSDIWGRW